MLVFISHSSHDKPIARTIKAKIEAAGLDVWLDEAEIRVGQFIPEKISEGIRQSDVLCILLSNNSGKSAWVKRELNTFLPACISQNKILFPCKLDEALIPANISDIKYADFTKNIDFGVSEILSVFKLHEAVEFLKEANRLKNILLNEFSKAEIAYTIFHILNFKNGHIFLYRSEKGPRSILNKLNDHNLMSIRPDYKARSYFLTEEAKKAIELLMNENKELISTLKLKYELD